MMARESALGGVTAGLDPHTAVVLQLGWAGRSFYQLHTGPAGQIFYQLGAMGSVVPFALGIALAQPARGVLGIEGDGSLLMNLGAVSTLARYGPPNLAILILDNGCYESTGGQRSSAASIDWVGLLRVFDQDARELNAPAEITQWMRERPETPRGPNVACVRVSMGAKPPRIPCTPRAIGEDARRWLASS